MPQSQSNPYKWLFHWVMRIILSLDSEIKYTSLVQRKSVIIVSYTFNIYMLWHVLWMDTNDTKKITDYCLFEHYSLVSILWYIKEVCLHYFRVNPQGWGISGPFCSKLWSNGCALGYNLRDK